MKIKAEEMNQRKPPKKRYSSYIPPTEFHTLEHHVTNNLSPQRSHEEGLPHKPRNFVPSHFNAIQNAVSKLARIDDFDLEDLGYGFFSDVFKVTHKLTGKVMVLKRNKNTNTKLNILREVQLMNRLSHPNILKYMGVCVHEGQLHALTEFINGGDLDQLIENRSVVLSWMERISLSIDVACGIKYLHSMGIIHRDMTAKNCLVKINGNEKSGKSYTAIVADLGLAEKIPDNLDEENKLTMVGTPYYMAPEVLCNNPYNEKADIFSFGIILCQLIARVSADPDQLPRTSVFGLAEDLFFQLALQTNEIPPPELFIQIAYECCQVDPALRIEIGNILPKLYKCESVLKTQQTDMNDNAIVISSNPHKSQRIERKKQKYRAPTSPAHLIRSYSDITTDVVATSNHCHHHNTILQKAFMNPFSNLEYLDVGTQKIIDTPSAEMLALTFDLPIPDGESSPIRFRKSDTAGRTRSSSLLAEDSDSVFKQNSTSTDCSRYSQENYATYYHNIRTQSQHSTPPPSPLREIKIPASNEELHHARMRAVLFSPHGKKYSSWWLSCQQAFLNDVNAELSPVLSTVTKKSHKIPRSVSLPNLTIPSSEQSTISSDHPKCNSNHRHSIHISDSTYSNALEPDYFNDKVVFRKTSSNTKNRKSRSKTIDNVFHEMNLLECLPEEGATDNILAGEVPKEIIDDKKYTRSVSFSDDVANSSITSSSQTFTDETISSCSSSSGSGTGILMALKSGVTSFSKRKKSIKDDDLKFSSSRIDRSSRDSGYNDEDISTSFENIEIT